MSSPGSAIASNLGSRRVAATLLLATAWISSSCSSGSGQVPLPPPPEVRTDPRVSEMRVQVTELVDRMEVMQARLNRMEDALSELASIRSQPQRAAAPARVAEESTAAVERYGSASNAADLYQEGLLFFARGQNAKARETFSKVYQTDPLGELADNALFWIAETHFVMNEMTEAIAIYDRLVDAFPSQNKAPDAMHKKALALVKLGDLTLARRTLETLIEAYPYSTAASAAKRELERIRY